MENILAIVSLIVTIILGGGAMIQSWRYNELSNKIVKDMKLMIVQQIKLTNELNKRLCEQGREQNIIDMSKDGIRLHKLATFKKKDIDKIMEQLNHLAIKRNFLEKIEEFLKGDEDSCKYNFRGKAKSDSQVDISELYEILLKYNVLISIDYQ